MRTAMVAEALYIHSFNRHDTMKPILANLHIADAFCLQRFEIHANEPWHDQAIRQMSAPHVTPQGGEAH
jgi:hypothetical protein